MCVCACVSYYNISLVTCANWDDSLVLWVNRAAGIWSIDPAGGRGDIVHSIALNKKTKLLCLCDAKESHAMGGWPATVSESLDGKTPKPMTRRLAEQHLFSPLNSQSCHVNVFILLELREWILSQTILDLCLNKKQTIYHSSALPHWDGVHVCLHLSRCFCRCPAHTGSSQKTRRVRPTSSLTWRCSSLIFSPSLWNVNKPDYRDFWRGFFGYLSIVYTVHEIRSTLRFSMVAGCTLWQLGTNARRDLT